MNPNEKWVSGTRDMEKFVSDIAKQGRSYWITRSAEARRAVVSIPHDAPFTEDYRMATDRQNEVAAYLALGGLDELCTLYLLKYGAEQVDRAECAIGEGALMDAIGITVKLQPGFEELPEVVRKLPDFMVGLRYLHWRIDSKFFQIITKRELAKRRSADATVLPLYDWFVMRAGA